VNGQVGAEDKARSYFKTIFLMGYGDRSKTVFPLASLVHRRSSGKGFSAQQRRLK
jgi:hypothetical protein